MRWRLTVTRQNPRHHPHRISGVNGPQRLAWRIDFEGPHALTTARSNPTKLSPTPRASVVQWSDPWRPASQQSWRLPPPCRGGPSVSPTIAAASGVRATAGELRHVRRRPGRSADRPRPGGCRAGRLLDGRQWPATSPTAPRITGAVFVSAITPCLDASLPDNPEGGFTPEAAAGMQAGLRADPEGFLASFLTNFYSVPGDGEPRLMVPLEQVSAATDVAKQASLDALAICIGLWLTDFRADLAAMSVPTLVIPATATRSSVPGRFDGCHTSCRTPRCVISGGLRCWLPIPEVAAALLVSWLSGAAIRLTTWPSDSPQPPRRRPRYGRVRHR